MLSKKNQGHHLTKILDLPNYEVVGIQFLDNLGIVMRIKCQRDFADCPCCGNRSHHLHQNHYHTIQDLPWGINPVYLRINARQFKCKVCGKPFTEELEITPNRRSYTKRFALDLLDQVLKSNILAIAERAEISEYRIQHILEDAGQVLKERKPEGLKILGIDEIAWVKGGKSYCGVLVNLETHEEIGLVKSRKQEDMREVFESWGEEILQGIEYVSIDLWRPYKTLVEELMPNAEIVADRFHVMKIVNKELDKQRKEEYKKAQKICKKAERKKITEGLKNSKYVLLRNQDELTEIQAEKLETVKSVSSVLAEMHELKEQFRDIFEESKNWTEGSLRLLDWLLLAKDKFSDACKTIINWFGEITMYFECHITNGCVEGINNKIKQIKHSAYGFRNFGNFVTRTLLSSCKFIDLAY
jgi:transposase